MKGPPVKDQHLLVTQQLYLVDLIDLQFLLTKESL